MKETEYHGFKRIDFMFENTEAILVFPNSESNKKNWVFKMEYFDAFPDVELSLLKDGYYLAFLKNMNRWCMEEDLDKKKRFCDYLTKIYGLNEKCVPVGMSCGGLIATSFAIKYPEHVSVMYLDAPVLNLLSCPGGFGVAKNELLKEFLTVTGMTISELVCYRNSPIDKMESLKESKIPVVLIYGEQDIVVPFIENGMILKKYLDEHNIPCLCIGKSNCAHHPHGLDDSSIIVDFIESHN